MKPYKFYAFISYSRKDEKAAGWIQHKLESYNLPSRLAAEDKNLKRGLQPVFRDKTDLGAGVLYDSLSKELSNSKTLVVICSPDSAKSEWVGNEIREFLKTHSEEDIIPVIVRGKPHSGDDEECFNPALTEISNELLGISFLEIGRQQALTKIVAKVLNLGFDELWQRQKRILRRKRILIMVGILAVLGALIGVGTWVKKKNQPVDIQVTVVETSEHNTNLPDISSVIVRMDLENEVKTDTVASLTQTAVFSNIPARFVGQSVRLTLEAPHCLPTDTLVVLNKNISLSIRRDARVYGHIDRVLYSFSKERPLRGVQVSLAGESAVTDKKGRFVMDIPLSKQSKSYELQAGVPLMDNKVYVPSTDGSIILAQ